MGEPWPVVRWGSVLWEVKVFSWWGLWRRECCFCDIYSNLSISALLAYYYPKLNLYSISYSGYYPPYLLNSPSKINSVSCTTPAYWCWTTLF